MMIELTEKIFAALKDNGLDVREIGFKDLIDKTINLTRPAVNITINQARAQKVTAGSTYKWICFVTLSIVFQNLQGGYLGEGKRKEGIYKLIEAISDYLTLQDFGLALENPLIMDSFRNITTYDLAKAGYQLYELKFWCSYNVTYEDPQDKDMGQLRSILAEYWFPPDSTTIQGANLINIPIN